MILWLRQLTATLESDLDCKTKSLTLGERYITQTKCFTGLRNMNLHVPPPLSIPHKADVIFGRGVSVKGSVRNVLPANNETISAKEKFSCLCVCSWLQLFVTNS